MCNKNAPKVPKSPGRYRQHVTERPEREVKTYGAELLAESEGDLYEMIVGRRSAVLDQADAERDSRS